MCNDNESVRPCLTIILDVHKKMKLKKCNLPTRYHRRFASHLNTKWYGPGVEIQSFCKLYQMILLLRVDLLCLRSKQIQVQLKCKIGWICNISDDWKYLKKFGFIVLFSQRIRLYIYAVSVSIFSSCFLFENTNQNKSGQG